jgi:DNA gyrase subunit B
MKRASGATSGENGTGTACYTALASEIIIESRRPQEKKKLTLIYQEGILVDEILEENYTGPSGMTTTFKPSKQIMGSKDIPIDILLEWFKGFDYTLDKGTKFEYWVNKKHYQVKHKDIDQFFDDKITDDKRLNEPIFFQCKGAVDETFNNKTETKDFTVEAAIIYSNADYKGESIRYSWMNRIYNMSNGDHMNGTINGLSKYVIQRVIKKNSKLKDDDLKRDVLANLHVVIKCSCTMAHMFSGQSKEKVMNTPLRNAITEAVFKELNRMSQTRLDELVEICIQNNRVRKAGEQSRHLKSATRTTKWEKPSSYIPAASSIPKSQRELFLVEGLSAMGGLRAARDNNQAILAFRGKNLNVWEEDLTRVMKNDPKNPWLNLVQILECGIGPTFDINKLAFDKILIATDADVDGYFIVVGFLAFLYKYMPEIISSGRVYICEPPLYKVLKNKDELYVASKNELIATSIRSINDIDIEFVG